MRIPIMLASGVLGGGVAELTYDEYMISLAPLLHFPLNETSGTTAINYGTLGTAANGAYVSTVALAQTTGPGGGWAPYWSAASSTQRVNIYSAAFAAAHNPLLCSVIVWWKVHDADVWTDGTSRYIYTIGADANNVAATNRTTGNGAINHVTVFGGTLSYLPATGYDETTWMCSVYTISKAANEYKIYENAVRLDTRTLPGTWAGALAAGECSIGNNRTLSYPWHGYLAQFSVFDKILTQTEITDIYAKGIASLSALPANSYLAGRAESALTIPTYDESGQAIHPSVYYNADGWNGHKYWMVMTPYTASNGLVENPSIVVSANGTDWSVPEGLTNPIYAYTANGYNSDPELTFDGGKLYVTFRDSSDATHYYFKQISSTDGITWSAAADLFNTVSPAEEVSPAIVYANSKYYMFTVLNVTPSTLRRRECATINGTWSDPVDVTLSYSVPLPHQKRPWHISVIKKAGTETLLMVMSTVEVGYIYLAQSTDYGATWAMEPWYLLTKGTAPAWDDYSLYRGCMAYVGADLVLWYSAQSVASTGPTVYAWATGKTTITEV